MIYFLMSESQKLLIQEELFPLKKRHEKTPTYIPAVLINLKNTYMTQKFNQYQAIEKCVQDGIPLIAHILHEYRTGKATIPYDPDMTLNFNNVAGQLCDNPTLANQMSFTLSPEGKVELAILNTH